MKKNRLKKLRGWGVKRRAVKVHDITERGFKVYIYNKEHYISREIFAWFLGANKKEIVDVEVFICKSDHGRYGLHWKSLDVQIGENDFKKSEQHYVYLSSHAYREQYNKQKEKQN